MIIRNQDKNKICILNGIDTLQANRYGEVYAYNGAGDTRCDIATYSTREKAVKVLDMICEQYQYCQECKCGLFGINKPDFVFQMPQDSEVSVE